MDTTSWSLIHGAANGRRDAREEFARRYIPVVRAYLCARWRQASKSDIVGDAVQEVLMECFRDEGVLEKADSSFDGGFSAYLFGVARNVARSFEKNARKNMSDGLASSIIREGPSDPHDSPSRAFDRAWAQSIMREAAEWQRQRAAMLGEQAQRRVELLKLRFEKGLPIREIAEIWGEDAKRLHHDYAKARREFREAVEDVVRSHGGTETHMQRQLGDLLESLKS